MFSILLEKYLSKLGSTQTFFDPRCSTLFLGGLDGLEWTASDVTPAY